MIAEQPTTLGTTEKYVRNLYNSHADHRLLFHNYALTQQLVQAIDALSFRNEIRDEASVDLLKTSAWFYFTGHLLDPNDPLPQSIEMAKSYLEVHDADESNSGAVARLIQSASIEKTPEFLLAQTLKDAVQGILFGMDFQQTEALERLELEWMGDKSHDDYSWAQFKLQQLLTVRFLTKGGKELYEPELAKNILFQKNKLEKLRKKVQNEERLIEVKEEFTPSAQRTIQTFFKANYRNHINLSSIADNKANIMISVNAILISVVISILSYRNIMEANPMIFMPAIIFLVTGLTSLIFAVLSARPKVTSLNSNTSSPENIKKNLVFFGNFVKLDIDQYMSGMQELFKDDKLLVDNMTRDLYYLGKVLDKKYRFLSVSYNVFMAGFVVTVLSFLFVFLTS
ncbi:MAG: DUF5706 domain-containing protein [Saprospiraceae bacterium]